VQEPLEDPIYSRFSRARKGIILALMLGLAFIQPLTSNMYMPLLGSLAVQLQTTETMMTLTVALYLAGMAIFPCLWGTLSDHYGRRPIIIIAMGAFFVF